MTARLEVTSVEMKGKSIQFKCDSDSLAEGVTLEPSSQVLVDSDSLSFIYILETDESFIYVSIPKDHWGHLCAILEDRNKEGILSLSQHGTYPMTGLKDELEYLIQNISGNTNYGSEMMNRVEEIFQPVKE